MKRILAIWLPNWPIQRLVRAKPELKQSPLVIHRNTRRGECVVACCQIAAKMGVEIHMPVAEAKSLFERQETDRDSSGVSHTTIEPKQLRVPAVHFEPYDPVADRTSLEQLANWCHRFSPIVGLEEIDPAETILLDATETAHLFAFSRTISAQPEQEILNAFLQRVHRSFVELGMAVKLAIGETVGAAWAMAHFGGENISDSKCWTVGSLANRTEILSLPVEALRLPDNIVVLLYRLGLERIGDLVGLPRAELKARLGDILLRRLDQIWGEENSEPEPFRFRHPELQRSCFRAEKAAALNKAQELISSIHPEVEFAADWSFEYPVVDQETIDFVVQQLLDRLCTSLLQQNRGALSLICQFNGSFFSVGLFRPTAEKLHLHSMIAMHLERLTLREPVTRISIDVDHHAPLVQRQHKLFADDDSSNSHCGTSQTAKLVDRLTSRLGEKAVVQCVLQRDAEPEKAYREVPFVRNGKRKAVRKPGASYGRQTNSRSALDASNKNLVTPLGRSTISSPFDRPLQLFPMPIAVRCDVASKGFPVCFHWRGQKNDVAHCWGPERIETGWWRSRAKRTGTTRELRPGNWGIFRDYFRVETSLGPRFWIFHCLIEKRWFLHGVF